MNNLKKYLRHEISRKNRDDALHKLYAGVKESTPQKTSNCDDELQHEVRTGQISCKQCEVVWKTWYVMAWNYRNFLTMEMNHKTLTQ